MLPEQTRIAHHHQASAPANDLASFLLAAYAPRHPTAMHDTGLISRSPPTFRFGQTPQVLMQASPNEIKKVPGGEFIDTQAMLEASTFKIKPDDLIELSKKVLLSGVGVDDESVLADNFEFCAPFVGPLGKDEYVGALKNFDLLGAFPDLNNRFYNLHVDPFEHNRVWWFTRATATHTGPLLGKPPTNKKLELPPQANSFTFDENGKVTQVTVGYVMDRRVGNTGGLGGAFAFFYGTGNPLPIPECRPYKKSFRFRALGWLAEVGKRFSK